MCFRNCQSIDIAVATGAQCEQEWNAWKRCLIDEDCNDSAGTCEAAIAAFDACLSLAANRSYCERNCPDLDLDMCVQDPDVCAARLACNTYCTRQTLDECVEQWLTTSRCEFDDGVIACELFCPDVGASPVFCAQYWEQNGECPDGPGPPVECVATQARCANAEIDPIAPVCTLGSPPVQQDGCSGDESLVNPTSCTSTGSTVIHQITALKVNGDCNEGYDLDGCDGASCNLGSLAPDEGEGGIDNALAGLGSVLQGVGGSIGGVDQALHEGLCSGAIDLQLIVDVNSSESCAVIDVRDGDASIGAVFLNYSETGCLSGVLGSIPLQVAGVSIVLDNATIRATASPAGLSDAVLGVTARQASAEVLLEQVIDGGSAVARQVLDISESLEGDADASCDAMSLTLSLGGVAQPE
jgi:hypothetical protein